MADDNISALTKLRQESRELRSVGLKRCTICKQIKIHAEFSKTHSRWDGLNPKCRKCSSTYRLERTARDPDWQKRKSAKSRAKNSVQLNARAREKYHEDIEAYRLKGRKRRENNPEYYRAYSQKWRAANREGINRKTRERRALQKSAGIKRSPPSEASRLRKNARAEERRQENKESINQRYRKRHKERYESDEQYRKRCLASTARYHSENREVIRTIRRNRKARLRKANGAHSAADVKEILKSQRGRCANPACRKRLRTKYHVDHIVPLAKGGSNNRKNLQIMCQICNQKKHSKDPIEWARENGLLL